MKTNAKTFRYTHIFKNIAILYFLFLFLLIYARISPDPDILKIVLIVITLGIGVLLLIIYRTNSIIISDMEITKRTMLGTKSIKWSEISSVSSRGTSLNLHKDSTALSFSSQLYGSKEIFNLLFSKRPDLFDAHKNNPFVRSIRNNVGMLSIGLLLIILALLLYFIKDYVFTAGFLGIFFCLQALFVWYTSPRKIALEGENFVFHHANKSVSISVDDIDSVQIIKTKQEQFKSVLLVFKNKTHMEISGYKQTPLIIYPVLKQWHEKYSTKESSIPA